MSGYSKINLTSFCWWYDGGRYHRFRHAQCVPMARMEVIAFPAGGIMNAIFLPPGVRNSRRYTVVFMESLVVISKRFDSSDEASARYEFRPVFMNGARSPVSMLPGMSSIWSYMLSSRAVNGLRPFERTIPNSLHS